MTDHTTSAEREIVVVGGGQTGLAIGYFLKRQGRDFTILEADDESAAAWRQRWDSLRLFTPVRRNGLPGRPFPGDPGAYPGRDEVVAYLTDYAREMDLPVEFGSRVRAVRASDDGGYIVELDDRTMRARQVVIATGPFQVPAVPSIAERLDPAVVQMHSTEYRRPEQLPAGVVLVVGGGNTGYQIAEELADAGREVHLSVGARQTPLPQRLFGRDLFDYLEASRLMRVAVTSRVGSRLQRRETLIGSSPRAARRRGIQLHGRAVEVAGREVSLADGGSVSPAAIIWATGFRLDHSFVQLPVFDGDRRVVHQRGVTAAGGLYFLGLPWQHTRGSALLGWVKDDAEFIAERIAEFAAGDGVRAAESLQQAAVR
jgi:putative flavoprotein involved in K+ transport